MGWFILGASATERPVVLPWNFAYVLSLKCSKNNMSVTHEIVCIKSCCLFIHVPVDQKSFLMNKVELAVRRHSSE